MEWLGLGGYSTGQLLFLAGAIFFAGLGRGFAGFGGALIFVPLASSIIGPAKAATLLLVVDAFIALPLIPNAVRLADKRECGIMAIGTLIGTPIGAMILTHAEPVTVRWMITGLVVMLLALVISGWRYRGTPAPPLAIGVGALAGLLNGIAQVGGPPVIAYWLGGTLSAAQVRANIIFYFALSSVIAIVVYAAAGLFVWALVGLAMVTAVPYALGLWLGVQSFGLASEETFRRICYALIALAAVIGLPLLDHILRG